MFTALRMLIFIAVIGVTAAIASAQVADWSSAEVKSLQQAQQDQQAGRDAHAITLLESLRAAHPQTGDLPRLLAHSYYAVGRYDDARRAAVDAIGLGRMTTDVLTRLVQIDRQRGDGVATLNTVRLLTVTDATNATWRIVLGDLLTSTGSFAEAESIYRDLLADHPARADLWLRLGNALLRSGNESAAIDAFETAWQLGRHDASVAQLLAGLYQKTGDTPSAVTWTGRAADLQSPADPATQLRLAQLLAARHDDDRATAIATKLAESAPANIAGQASLLLGSVALRAGDTDAAIQRWVAARKQGVSDPTYLATLGQLQFQHKQYAQAAQSLADYVKANPTDQQPRLLLAQSLLLSGDAAGAKLQLRDYLEQFGMDRSAADLIRQMARVQPSGAPHNG